MSDCQGLGDCDDDRMKRIYEYVDGVLSREDVEDIKAHLDSCADCANEYSLECLIRTVVKRSCREAAPETLKERILARISHAETASAV
ncbi:mycothiol system anti-sigma-R factor [Arthrobacter mobilis]|uniref:Mycothiol system anti-sigma-R factor n=1 Tax=Arthrobacter mobilis TaxID=2724944 RepID=A0A7X6K4D8_9MICC|nr:mycothiol system anti-sigma-R factor [Arthrobacter mobilis]NKX54520.1 mycothiol system anti-sigma-R factor [Arthrobacter mobilis]